MALFKRREKPPFSLNYRDYKPFLRRDFLYQCVYCERTEAYMGGEESFEVEHFRPASTFSYLSSEYQNLYYSCRGCNGHKSSKWPTENDIASGRQFADPCLEDLYQSHLRECDDGDVDPITPCGEYSRRHLRLHRKDVKDWRSARRIARKKLPVWRALEAYLKVKLTTPLDEVRRAEVEQQIQSVREYLEEAKLRFSFV